MTTYTKIIALTLLLIGGATVTHAETDRKPEPLRPTPAGIMHTNETRPGIVATSTRPQDRGNGMQASSTGEMRGRPMIASTTDMEREQNMEKRNADMKKSLDTMVDRLSATIDRLSGIETRAESRATKIKTNGGITTDTDKLLADSKAKIADAQSKLDTLKASIDTAVANETATSTPTGDALKALKKTTDIITKDLQSAQKSLEKAVNGMMKTENALKGSEKGKGMGSTTPRQVPKENTN